MKVTKDKKGKFSALFDKFYLRLFNYAYKVLNEKEVAEELVQETFIKLWENFSKISSDHRSIESYLIVTLKNKIIDYHRKNVVREKHINLFTLNKTNEEQLNTDWELIKAIDNVYASLQTKTIEIFRSSRDKGLSYKEIAIKMDISVKTVELHISKALSAFKKGLKDYL